MLFIQPITGADDKVSMTELAQYSLIVSLYLSLFILWKYPEVELDSNVILYEIIGVAGIAGIKELSNKNK
jgi:hypothetical protein